jgi:hypothetical protein
MARAKIVRTAKLRIPARIVLVSPPAGVAFALQRGKRELAAVWTRRAKVGLERLKWPVIHRVTSQRATLLEARISGTGRDGGPVCASVPVLGGGWAAKKPGE